MGVALNLGQEPISEITWCPILCKRNSFNVFFHDNPPAINECCDNKRTLMWNVMVKEIALFLEVKLRT